jgi:excisionase family DNA binding protein
MKDNQIGGNFAEAFLTKIEVAQILRITSRSVDEWMRRGFIPFYKIGRSIRIKREDLEQHLKNTCRVAGRTASSLSTN